MTIEVRQMVIRSNVGGAEAPIQRTQGDQPDWREQLRQEVMAECKAWVEDRLRRERER